MQQTHACVYLFIGGYEMNNNGHGGARKGSGRKKKAETAVSFSVSMTPEESAKIKDFTDLAGAESRSKLIVSLFGFDKEDVFPGVVFNVYYNDVLKRRCFSEYEAVGMCVALGKGSKIEAVNPKDDDKLYAYYAYEDVVSSKKEWLKFNEFYKKNTEGKL